MNVVGAVTAGAAGLAAILSGANLYLSGRRELDKWTRETLVEIFVLFLDASFKQTSASLAIMSELPPQLERNRLRQIILESHDKEKEALTRLRLMAPPRVVESARVLMDSEHALAEPCFMESLPIDSSADLIERVRQGRTRFLQSARSALGLRVTAGTGDFGETVSWRELRIFFGEGATQEEH
jgi:hypothetical protein